MKFFIYVAGASCSGKTTLSRELAEKLAQMGIRVEVISMDDYYKAIPKVTGNENYDRPEAFEMDLIHKHLNDLVKGVPIERPTYSFETHAPTKETEHIDPQTVDGIILEGLFPFEFKTLPVFELRVFVEANSYLTYYNRRKERDLEERNTSLAETRNWELDRGVRVGFFSGVASVKYKADEIVSNNSYEELTRRVGEIAERVAQKFTINNQMRLG